jgi:hypothetical protein
MNPKPNRSFLARPISWFAFSLLLSGVVFSPDTIAQTTDTFYYWVRPGISRRQGTEEQSFVIPVTPAQAGQIEAIKQDGGRAGVAGNIAAGPGSNNKNYLAPRQPSWNWHFTSVSEIYDLRHTLYIQCMCPFLIDYPSDIAANADEWIRVNGNVYNPEYWEVQDRIDPTKPDSMANVSNRGLTGTGEKTLITGFIITGGEPRNVVVRALGPSLSASGIQLVAANPKIAIYKGSSLIAGNKDWKTDMLSSSLAQNYPSLAPTNDKEAALLVTLLPGTYTVQGINEDGMEGIMLLEAYDVDSATVP